MPYCVTGPSYVPKYFPIFDWINEDGSEFQPPNILGANSDNLALKGGFRLTEVTNPSIGSLCRYAILRSAHKSLPDIFIVGGQLCVSQSMRDAIESLESNVHQFFSVALFRKKDVMIDEKYYLLNICQILDSLVFDKSNLHVAYTRHGDEYVVSGLSPKDYRTLCKAVIQGKHLWREKTYLSDFYISDGLYALFIKQPSKGVYHWEHMKVNEE
jgi:hypothetical protein